MGSYQRLGVLQRPICSAPQHLYDSGTLGPLGDPGSLIGPVRLWGFLEPPDLTMGYSHLLFKVPCPICHLKTEEEAHSFWVFGTLPSVPQGLAPQCRSPRSPQGRRNEDSVEAPVAPDIRPATPRTTLTPQGHMGAGHMPLQTHMAVWGLALGFSSRQCPLGARAMPHSFPTGKWVLGPKSEWLRGANL